jgi:hypothetical protein
MQRPWGDEVDELPWRDIAGWLGAAVLAVMGWLGKVLWTRVDEKADKVDLDQLIHELREDREAARESRGRLYERVNTMAETVARLEGRLAPRPGPR